VRQRPSLPLPQSLLFMAVVGLVLGITVSAFAEPILRLVTFTVADPSKQDQALQVAGDVNKLFVAAKGFQSLKFSYDPATGQNVGVSLWDSQAEMEAVTQAAYAVLYPPKTARPGVERGGQVPQSSHLQRLCGCRKRDCWGETVSNRQGCLAADYRRQL